MCPMVMVVMPRPAGQPISCSIATNSSSRDSPVITSGMTRGRGGHGVQGEAAPELREARQPESGERAEDHRRPRH